MWHTDCVYGEDNLINFLQISINIRLNYAPFLTLASCFQAYVVGIVFHKHPL